MERPSRFPAWTPWLLLSAAGVRCLLLIGDFPSGTDGAALLLTGTTLLGGPNLTGAGSRGDALIPLLVALLGERIGPLHAVRSLELVSFLAVLLASYSFALRWLKAPFGAAVAVLAVSSRSGSEATFSGSCQQNFALAALVLLAGTAADYLQTGRRRDAIRTGIGLVLVALCHWAFTPIALVVLGASAVLTRPRARGSVRGIVWSALPASVLWTAFSYNVWRAGYALPGDWTGGLAGVWTYAFPGVVWQLAAAAGLTALFFHRSPGRFPAIAMGLGGVAAMITVPHPRGMPPVAVAAMIGLGLFLQGTVDAQPTRFRRMAVGAAAIGLFAALTSQGDEDARAMRAWYRVADRDLVGVADWIRDGLVPGAAVAVNATLSGAPAGLWVAVLTGAPTLVGADPSLLSYPPERDRARRAASLFGGETAWETARARARSEGVSVLVSDKSALPQWPDWVRAAGPYSLQSGRFVAFAVRP